MVRGTTHQSSNTAVLSTTVKSERYKLSEKPADTAKSVVRKREQNARVGFLEVARPIHHHQGIWITAVSSLKQGQGGSPAA